MTAVGRPTEWSDRYFHVDKVLTRDGPFTNDFTPGNEPQDFLRTKCKILVIGKPLWLYVGY